MAFLQDNCTCPECFHESSKSRIKLRTSLDFGKEITSVVVNPDGNGISCTWSDGHLSNFSEKWLLARNFTDENIKKRKEVQRDNPKLFGSDYKIERASYDVRVLNFFSGVFYTFFLLINIGPPSKS